jgi:hypothetical protein
VKNRLENCGKELTSCCLTNTVVADLSRAVAGEMTDLTAVVALLALGAVTRHVAETTAGVAGLTARSAVTLTTLLLVTTLLLEATLLTTLGAVAGNVADLTTLVAFLRSAHTGTTTGSTTLGALAGDVTSLTTSVAGLLLLGVGALAREMALATAVVASGVALGGAVAGLVGNVAACSEVC